MWTPAGTCRRNLCRVDTCCGTYPIQVTTGTLPGGANHRGLPVESEMTAASSGCSTAGRSRLSRNLTPSLSREPVPHLDSVS